MMRARLSGFLGIAVAVLAFATLVFSPGPEARAATTQVVHPGDMGSWTILNYDAGIPGDVGDATTASGTDGDFVAGPGTPPLGSGSHGHVIGTNGDDATRIITDEFDGLALSALTELSYSTYVTANVGGQATYVQLRVDTTGDGVTDDRLFFEPVYQTGGYGMLSYSPAPVPNQCPPATPLCVAVGAWQTWDADVGGWWSLNDSAGGPPLTTLAAYAAQYPGAALATDLPAFRMQAGGGAGAWDNFDGAFDALTVNGTTFDFELVAPVPGCTFTTLGSVMHLDGDCTTDESIVIPDGMTIEGHYFTITAVDPTGGHFTGGVIQNGGAIASVKRVKIDAGGLANVCDAGADRVRGILFDGASGRIYRNTILALNQGASGCQEGNGIEVRNAPFDGTHPGTKSVVIDHNRVENWMKTGILANGDVDVSIKKNTVGASATQANLAANSIQAGFGAIGDIKENRLLGNEWSVNDSAAATAILVYLADADVHENRIGGASDVGIYFSTATGSIEKNRVSDNGVDAFYDYGIGIWYGTVADVVKNRVCGFEIAYSDDDDSDGNPWVIANKNRVGHLRDCDGEDNDEDDDAEDGVAATDAVDGVGPVAAPFR